MPYRNDWVPNEVFLAHKNVVIYHAYKDDDFAHRLVYWYCLGPDDNEYESFDIRELQSWSAYCSHEDILKTAIESGEIQKLKTCKYNGDNDDE